MPTQTHNRIPGIHLIQASMAATALDIRVEPRRGLWLWFWGFVDGGAVGGWHFLLMEEFVGCVTGGQRGMYSIFSRGSSTGRVRRE
jgi:hypothetical protein